MFKKKLRKDSSDKPPLLVSPLYIIILDSFWRKIVAANIQINIVNMLLATSIDFEAIISSSIKVLTCCCYILLRMNGQVSFERIEKIIKIRDNTEYIITWSFPGTICLHNGVSLVYCPIMEKSVANCYSTTI